MTALPCVIHQTSRLLSISTNKPFSCPAGNRRPSLCRRDSRGLVKADQWQVSRHCTFQIRCAQHSTARQKPRADNQIANRATETCSSLIKASLQHLILPAALLLGCGGLAHAAGADSVANVVSSAVPAPVSSAVSSTLAPVAERTAAFIPGLVGDSPLREGAVQGFLLILFSELGDKTFFLAVLLALKENKSIVFAGTFGALALMTLISVALGQVLHEIDQLEFTGSKIPFDDLLAVSLLVFFGIKTIQEARNADQAAAEEREEAEEEVQKLGKGALGLFFSTFALVFAAEWGDKSFLATIALAAASSPTGVVLGAIGGHGVATGIAVVGGSYLGRYVDERVVQYVGGSLFLVFAAATVVDIARGV